MIQSPSDDDIVVFLGKCIAMAFIEFFRFGLLKDFIKESC